MNRKRVRKPITNANLTGFFTRKVSVFPFLALSIFFAVILVVFGQPTGILRYTSQQTATNPLLQVAIATACGLAVLIMSRIVLYFFGSRHTMTPTGIGSWLLAEMIVVVALLSVIIWLLSGKGHLILAPLAGDIALGILGLEVIPYALAYLLFLLHEERNEVERLRKLLPQEHTDEYSTGEQNVQFYDKSGRLVLATARRNVLYIEAANNYTNIHYLNEDREETFILHNSLKELEQRLAGSSLIRCHRGYIVNLDNVKLMKKEGIGFMLELSGTTRTIPVTKTYADFVRNWSPSEEV